MPRLLSTVIDAVGGNPSLPHMLALSVLIKNRIAIEDEALCVSSRIELFCLSRNDSLKARS